MTTADDHDNAIARIKHLTAVFRRREQALEDARRTLADEIVGILKARTLKPSEIEEHGPYKRAHIARIAKDGGVPPLREGTVVSKRAVTAPTPEQP